MKNDDAYANAAFIPDGESYFARWAAAAQAFRAQARMEPDLPYGPGPREVFDLFLPEGAARGCVVFVHGGYWMESDKSDWSHLAAGAVARGWAVAMPNYPQCPDVTVAEITRGIATALETIAARVPGPLRLTGHSAGGQLVARVLDPEVGSNVLDRVSQVMPISPLADLRPLLDTSMNATLGLDLDMAVAESPVRQPAPATQVTVWVGADERPAFLDQARWLTTAWGCDQIVAKGRHHFDVIDDLTDPGSDMVTTLLGPAL